MSAKKMGISIPRGSILVFDRGYLDYAWWNKLNTDGIFFVTRPRKNAIFVVSAEYKIPSKKILSDQKIWLGDILKMQYPQEMRRVKYLNGDGEVYEYVTNNFRACL